MKNRRVKVYHVKCYIDKNGISTEKTVDMALKKNNNYFILNKKYFELIPKLYNVKKLIPISFCYHKVSFQNDNTILGEAWCKSKDYDKTKSILVKMIIEQIPSIIIKTRELERDLKIKRDKLKDYKKGLNTIIKKTTF